MIKAMECPNKKLQLAKIANRNEIMEIEIYFTYHISLPCFLVW